jgi:hypothetical protein
MQFDFQTMTPMDRYELLLGTVLPRPITIVTTLSTDGALNAAPYSLLARSSAILRDWRIESSSRDVLSRFSSSLTAWAVAVESCSINNCTSTTGSTPCSAFSATSPTLRR